MNIVRVGAIPHYREVEDTVLQSALTTDTRHKLWSPRASLTPGHLVQIRQSSCPPMFNHCWELTGNTIYDYSPVAKGTRSKRHTGWSLREFPSSLGYIHFSAHWCVTICGDCHLSQGWSPEPQCPEFLLAFHNVGVIDGLIGLEVKFSLLPLLPFPQRWGWSDLALKALTFWPHGWSFLYNWSHPELPR